MVSLVTTFDALELDLDEFEQKQQNIILHVLVNIIMKIKNII